MPLSTLFLLALFLILVVIVVILIARTAVFPIDTAEVEPMELPQVDGESVAQRLGLAIQLKTISSSNLEEIDPTPFRGLHNLMHTLYPMVDEKLEKEIVNEYGLLYTWKGSNPSLDPVCFLAHLDVVPADEAEDSGWKYPPFSGTIAEGYVWGRGAIDCKGVLIGQMEAIDSLLREGYQPLRTIYLAFGFDEENSGRNGAAQMANTLQQRGVKLSFLLDEGGAITTDQIKAVSQPVAAVGVSEKGFVTLRLHAKTASGHASMPPTRTAIGSLSLALATLEANPFPQKLGVIQVMLSHLGKALPFIQRMALANTWLFGGLVRKQMASQPSMNALTRTTLAPTLINGGHTSNVLPAEADAVINLRIMEGETREEVFQRVNNMVADDIVSVLPYNAETLQESGSWNPSPVSDVDSPQFALLANLIMAAYPTTLVMPILLAGATDARFYAPFCRNAYRFSPFVLSSAETASVHGINERLSVANCAKAVGFYMELMRHISSLTPEEEAAFGSEEDWEEEEKPAEERKTKAPRASKVAEPEDALIAELHTPLPTKPLKKPAAQTVAYPREARPVESPTPEHLRSHPQDFAEDLQPLPDDDQPLTVKPMKKG
ncbi:MAG TPA: M20/M25/M40 family metallo-hydrolase [Anaerolineaceae bacterium]|nr:M20/M25/M40 family metallo-hydrolase [Anaerolineaceae bacterium]